MATVGVCSSSSEAEVRVATTAAPRSTLGMDWQPFAQQSSQATLLEQLKKLGVEPAKERRSRAELTVALGEALGGDVSALVDARGRVLCRAALFSKSGRCPNASRCALSHDIPPAALESIAVWQRRLASERDARAASARRALAMPQPRWLERRRRARVLHFDTSAHKLREALAAVLELDRFVPDGAPRPGGPEAPGSEPLERRLQQLHAAQPAGLAGPPPLCPALMRGLVLAGRALPARWKRAHRDKRRTIQRLGATAAWEEFVAAYERFVAQVVAPACARRPLRARGARGGQGSGSGSGSEQDEEGEGGALAYQRPPTVRVHTPGRVSPIGLHCDADYPQHEGAEINVWVPVTSAAGSSALWLESSPGAADFAPAELRYGQLLVFNGCRCRHYAMPNATGATRVSFDFRVIPTELWRDDYGGQIGDYPAAVVRGDLTESTL